MAIKTLKDFQETAVSSAVEVFSYAKGMLDAAGDSEEGKAVAVHDNGYVLIEAPTGAGKTLMAGTIAERMSGVDDVVWFWFAPFKGVVDQTAAFLREQFKGLRLRTLAEDRNPSGTRKGDVFVTTWQMVATRLRDRRSVRQSGELNPSVDELVESLRDQGLRIGVVVDEAHHGFHGETQAAHFFRGVLKPAYTILVTATPDDRELEDLRQRMDVRQIHRISVSRSDAVSRGLIKDGIKCVAWRAAEGSAGLVDFEATALREGVVLHRMLKAELSKSGVNLVPLMLVQVASGEKSVERAKEKLMGLGFTEGQIAVHTADEPDANLLALANDEAREVLIFKMSVALGFDAPRAWTLVSMRAARDPDFGVQLVGRILRVHRRLQGKTVPELLRYGYVLLADPEAQAGIDLAGQRINQIQTEYARVSPSTVVVRVGDEDRVQVVGADGQATFLPTPPAGAIWTAPEGVGEEAGGGGVGIQGGLFGGGAEFEGPGAMRSAIAGILRVAPTPMGKYRYALRGDVPRRFKTQELPEDVEVTEEDCAKEFIISAEHLLDALLTHDKVRVEKRTLDVFTQAVQMELSFALPSMKQMRVAAQRELLRSEVFDAKELRGALMRKLGKILGDRGVEDAADGEKVGEYLDVLLVSHPELLRNAQRGALLAGQVMVEAEELPGAIEEDVPLTSSRKNVYQVLPMGLNSWEREFAGMLDGDVSGGVLWWHRNPVNKPWSIKVLLADGRGFYPDFVVGIEGRRTEGGGLLADTKYAYDRGQELPKILAEHEAYGRVVIVSKETGGPWKVVKMAGGRAVLGERFGVGEAAGY